MKTLENTTIYHEIDFLLPAQRFNINFSYITEKGLPFVREFVLRLIHLAPMSMSQVATFFGFSRKEVQEAIDDLVERGELTLSENGRLTLTEKSSSYFTELGEVPRLSLLRDSTACLSFDLATFSCLGKDKLLDKWKAGIPVKVDEDNASRSQDHVKKHFQRQFHQILQKGFLSKHLTQDDKDSPNVYTVNSVNKIKQMAFRLPVKFKMDDDGKNIEREDFEVLNSSDYIHAQISIELNRLAGRSNNLGEVSLTMIHDIRDRITIKLFDSKGEFKLKYLTDLVKLESNDNHERTTFVGPIYMSENWKLLQKHLAPIINFRRSKGKDFGHSSFTWIAPSDPFWGKSISLYDNFGNIVDLARSEDKTIYSPKLYVPISGPKDRSIASQWRQDFRRNDENLYGIRQGFLGGNVELLHLMDEFAVVIYHLSLPSYPVTFPVGFISADKNVVSRIGSLMTEYLNSNTSIDCPNDCGLIKDISARRPH